MSDIKDIAFLGLVAASLDKAGLHLHAKGIRELAHRLAAPVERSELERLRDQNDALRDALAESVHVTKLPVERSEDPTAVAPEVQMLRNAIGCLEHYKRQAANEQDFAQAADLRGGQFRLERILAERFMPTSSGRQQDFSPEKA